MRGHERGLHLWYARIMNHLPRLNRPTPLKPTDHSIHFSPILAEVAQLERGEVFSRMKTSPEGLSEEGAASRDECWPPRHSARLPPSGWPHPLRSSLPAKSSSGRKPRPSPTAPPPQGSVRSGLNDPWASAASVGLALAGGS